LVDYFEHLDISSEDILKCSANGDTSINRKCLQDAMSSWNARLALVPLERARAEACSATHTNTRLIADSPG
jgi:hypothetical protein